MRKKTLTTILLIAVLVLLLAAPGFSDNTEDELQPYIVFMGDDPVAVYKGEISGYAATAPVRGKKLDLDSRAAEAYTEYLEAQHDNALRSAGLAVSKKLHDYRYVVNGFAALLTAGEAKKLAKQSGVVFVRRDEVRHPTTENSPTFLGLTDPAGPWAKGLTGEGVVVGVIDTGIWPEHPSFTDDGSYEPLGVVLEDTLDRPACDFGNEAYNPNDAPFTCNNKLIGARTFLDVYKAYVGLAPGEFDSARDDDGHGTHTTSTAAGNDGVEAVTFSIPRGSVSGMAPRARIIAYRACAEGGCYSSDLAAAIDQAVADGVDVINYSIGGGAGLLGLDEIAFLNAADAGVFVAASAGNSGPDAGTVGGPASAPWLTAVGASTQDRAFLSDITLSGPGTPPVGVWGGSVTQGVTGYHLVDADGIADMTGDTSGQCLNPFPAGTFQASDAVLCNQYNFGVPRVERVENVAAGGGGAVIFHNSAAVSVLPTDNHTLPTVHVGHEVGNPLKTYLAANPGRVTVSFTQGTARSAADDPRVQPSVMASFSSRGPDTVAMDIIKPDVTAPGVNILAGASPVHVGAGAQGEYFQAISGTSMSSPHVAGVFALLRQAHPDWTPAMAKSAIMTTARQNVMKADGMTPADPFDMGSGHLAPVPLESKGKDEDDDDGEDSKDDRENRDGKACLRGSAFDPGVVYDSGYLDYLGFLCDAAPEYFVDPDRTCEFLLSSGVATDASDLNLASIGINDLAGSQTIIRRVTNVTREGDIELKVSVAAPPGFRVKVKPRRLKLDAGESAAYQVTITNDGSAVMGEWAFGSLTWRGDGYQAYSPIAVRPTLFSTDQELSGTGIAGTLRFDVKFGYTGPYTAAAHGLEPVVFHPGNVKQDPDQNFDPSDVATGGAVLHEFNLSGAAFLRLALPPESTEAGADLDLFVYDPQGNLVASSTQGDTNERVDILLPMDGVWQIYVHGWRAPGGDSDYRLYSWVVSATPGGSLSVDSAPISATMGDTGTIAVSWTGLTAGIPYLGAVSHTGPDGIMGLTLIGIDAQ